ncbi:MAG: hypothetical protein KC457_02065, partial [Myxococcales bacterium]|nr:hypothetical protein [Myxococcales bacterium]
MLRGRQTSTWALAVTLGLSGCGDDGPEPEPAWCEIPADEVLPGEVMELQSYGVPLGELCAGSMAAAERHALWVGERWGRAPEHFDYLLYDSQDEGCWPCSDGAGACTNSKGVHAPRFPHRHEIAHAVRPRGCYRFIEEGWATLYGDPF